MKNRPAHQLTQRIEGLFGEGPVLLLLNSRSVIGIIFAVAVAARQHETGGGERIEREFAQDESHLAGVDVALLQLRLGRLVEIGAMGAGQRRIFDDRHLGVGRARATSPKGAGTARSAGATFWAKAGRLVITKGRSSGGSEKLKRLAPGDHR